MPTCVQILDLSGATWFCVRPQHPAEDKNCLLRESLSVSATGVNSVMPEKLPKLRDGLSTCVVWRRQTTRHLESVKLPCLKDSPKAALASAEPGNSNSTPSSGTFLTSSKVAVLTGSVTHRKSIGTNQKCFYPKGCLEEGSMHRHRTPVALGASHGSSVHMCAQQS